MGRYGPTSLTASDSGNDTEGADLITSLLNLHHRPGSQRRVDQGDSLLILNDAEEFEHPSFVPIAHYPVDFRHQLELLWGPLGVASGSHQQGMRVLPSHLPDEVPRLSVCHLSDRAGIHDDDIGGLVRLHQLVS